MREQVVKGMFLQSILHCDHCKMSEHTKARCYKIHGYPPSHRGAYQKDKRFANMVQCENESTEGVSFTFTAAQVQQLLALLDKDKNQSYSDLVDMKETIKLVQLF